MTLCDAVLKLQPGHTAATWLKASLLARQSRKEEPRVAMPISCFLTVEDLPSPSGYAGGEEFRGTPRQETLRNRTLQPDPLNKSTVHGLQTGRLGNSGDNAIAARLTTIKQRVDAYADALDSGGAFIGRAAAVRSPRMLGGRIWQKRAAAAPSSSERLAERSLLRKRNPRPQRPEA